MVKAAALEKMVKCMDKMLGWDLNLIPILLEVSFGQELSQTL